jgi:uncharacterized Zn-binding protein involved in type VI secretion
MPAQARVGDPGIPHCSPYVILTGSLDVIVNGKPAAYVGSLSTPHLIPAGVICVTHVAPVVFGSLSVLINGKPAARVGDPLGDCTVIALGSFDVITG